MRVESLKANCSILQAWQPAWKPEAFWEKAKTGPKVGVERWRSRPAFTGWVTACAQMMAFPGVTFCIQRTDK